MDGVSFYVNYRIVDGTLDHVVATCFNEPDCISFDYNAGQSRGWFHKYESWSSSASTVGIGVPLLRMYTTPPVKSACVCSPRIPRRCAGEAGAAFVTGRNNIVFYEKLQIFRGVGDA
jgi:hypothetical protein